MANKPNLAPTKYNALKLSLSLFQCKVYEATVVGNNNSCDKIHVPKGWKGQNVYLVLKNE